MDLRWLVDLDLFGAETADAAEELTQDTYHVIEQDLGSNGDDPTRGLGVANMLSGQIPAGFTTTADTELAQDDRIDSVSSTLDIDTSGGPTNGQATLNVTITTNDDLLQQIDLTVPVGSNTAQVAA
jgi:hypothetical protein